MALPPLCPSDLEPDAQDEPYEDGENCVYLNLQDEDEEDEESQPSLREEAPNEGGETPPGTAGAPTETPPTENAPPSPTEALALGIDEQEACV